MYVHFHLVIFFQLCHRTSLMSPGLLWSVKHGLRNNELADLKGCHFSVPALLGSPEGHGTSCAIHHLHYPRCSMGPSTIFCLFQIVLSFTKCYCCMKWKQWWYVVATDCLSHVAVPVHVYLQALILLEAFIPPVYQLVYPSIQMHVEEKLCCHLSVEMLLTVKLCKG